MRLFTLLPPFSPNTFKTYSTPKQTKTILHPSTTPPSNASQQRGGVVANTVNKDAQTAGFASCLAACYLRRYALEKGAHG